MLETNEIDSDFFTPATNTSLSSLFSSTQTDRNDENKTLIYIPEAPTTIGETHKSVDDVNKATSQCLFATSVSAYEWAENKYNLREKLGFAIIKDSKDSIHHLILYTSEKRTLSLATITPTFVVNVQNNSNISYYDNFKKYWLISSQASKISEIIKYLEDLKVKLTNAETLSSEDGKESVKIPKQLTKENFDSETATFTNKNKDSILKRMATMGHSVLPISNIAIPKSTDSSDTNENDNVLIQRHKSTKSHIKRHQIEQNVFPGKQFVNDLSTLLPNKLEIQDSILPINVKNTEPSYENNMHSFISEQRISNSELRININRLSDKIEHLCVKTSGESLQSHSILNESEIVQKLLKEYERKIFAYEKFIKLKGFECDLLIANENDTTLSTKIESTVDQQIEIDKEKQIQVFKIHELNNKIDHLSKTFSETAEEHKKYEKTLLKEIDVLKQDLNDKNETLYQLNKSIQSITENNNTEDYRAKLKSVMNSTFQTISSKFNDEEKYEGAVVKNVVAKIIKKITMESLHDN